MPENSLKTAIIEHELGIVGTYYFRNGPESYDEKIIKQIAELGHEVGYHYENLSGTMNVERRRLNEMNKGKLESSKDEETLER